MVMLTRRLLEIAASSTATIQPVGSRLDSAHLTNRPPKRCLSDALERSPPTQTTRTARRASLARDALGRVVRPPHLRLRRLLPALVSPLFLPLPLLPILLRFLVHMRSRGIARCHVFAKVLHPSSYPSTRLVSWNSSAVDDIVLTVCTLVRHSPRDIEISAS